MSQLNLQNVTLTAINYNTESAFLHALVPVLRYMQTVGHFARIILWTAIPVKEPLPGVTVVRIPPTDRFGLGIWLADLALHFVNTPFMMHCQDDGFILDPSLWDPEFLAYDYIGAPWADGLVGNEGFSIQSRRFLWAKTQFEWDGVDGQDWFYCRTIREKMLGLGITFAPTGTAARFSSELCNHNDPSFGYHGRAHCPPKHAQGRKLVQPFYGTT